MMMSKNMTKELDAIWTNQANITLQIAKTDDGLLKVGIFEGFKTELNSVTLTGWRARRLATNILENFPDPYDDE
jgi:hypothetical protein